MANFSKFKKSIASLLIGASLLGLTSLGGLDYVVGKAYGEVQNVIVLGDIKVNEKSDYSKAGEGGVHTKLNEEAKEESLYNLVRNMKTFEYEGKRYKFLFVENVENKKIIRQNKVVFCTNFLKEKEFNRYILSDGVVVDMNYEIFTADVSDSKLTNIKRVTKTIDKNECGPIWLGDGNIAYQELNMNDLKKNYYYVMDIQGNILKEIAEEEYFKLRNQ